MRGTAKITKTEIGLLLLAAVFFLGMTVWHLTRSRPTGGGYEVTTAARRAIEETAVEKVNINTADAEALETVPGIGEVLAQRILAYRRQHGAFREPEELLNVSGIGEKTLETMRECITWEVTE